MQKLSDLINAVEIMWVKTKKLRCTKAARAQQAKIKTSINLIITTFYQAQAQDQTKPKERHQGEEQRTMLYGVLVSFNLRSRWKFNFHPRKPPPCGLGWHWDTKCIKAQSVGTFITGGFSGAKKELFLRVWLKWKTQKSLGTKPSIQYHPQKGKRISWGFRLVR